MRSIVPNSNQPIASDGGLVTPVWQRFFNGLTPSLDPISALPVSASPATYKAVQQGTVAISGGTLTAVALTRGAVAVALGASQRIVPVGTGDVVTVTYSVAPTMNFIPN